MQKALQQMNIQLPQVLSDITGETGMAIVRAIVAGERNGVKLAQFRDRGCSFHRRGLAWIQQNQIESLACAQSFRGAARAARA